VWTYLVRRFFAMIPTLFGITLVSFTIMQLAPGDPMMNEMGSAGLAGESSQTRTQYLLQKRDLKLDLPLVLNFRYFTDYSESMKWAAYFRGRSKKDIQKEIPALHQKKSEDRTAQFFFLKSLGIDDFEERLADPDHHPRLARAIEGFTQIYCEDMGKYGVPPLIDILKSDADAQLKSGAIKCLIHMVIDPFQYTYSKTPEKNETERVISTWQTWWARAKGSSPPSSPERQKKVVEKVKELSALTSRRELYKKMRQFKKSDAPFFMDILNKNSSLKENIIASLGLRLFIGKPLKTDLPLGASKEKACLPRNWELNRE